MAKGHFGPGMGRPRLLEDDRDTIATFEALMGIPFVTEDAVCEIFKVSESTLARWIKKNYKCTFDTLRQQKRSNMKLKLAGKQYETAMKGNVPMLIWLGKQWLEQSDKVEQKQDVTQKTEIVYESEWGNADPKDEGQA